MSKRHGLVSVITPCYNAASFVAETIKSVADQDYPDLEHIVIDDGSTDGSWSLLEGYGEGIKLLRLAENHGGSYARNRGVEVASGEFLLFLDADDLIAPDTISALVASVYARPGSIAVCRWQRLHVTPEGDWTPGLPDHPFPPPPDALRGWLMGNWVPPCAVLWRRDAYDCSGGWDEAIHLNDDGDLMMRALTEGAQLVPAVGGMALYRDHGDSRLSVSATVFTAERLESQRRILERISDRLKQLGRWEEYRVPLGIAYHRVALVGFRVGQVAVAREFLRQGEELGGCDVSRTRLGRLVARIVGLERKERIALALAKFGLMTRARRTIHRRGLLQSQNEQVEGCQDRRNVI